MAIGGICPNCNAIFVNKSKNPKEGVLCPRCLSKKHGAHRPPKPLQDKKLKISSAGYYYLTYPMCTKEERALLPGIRNILYHRLIMSKYLGRPLMRNEFVRHINGNKLDCRIENLSLGSPKDNNLDNKSAIMEMNKWKGIAMTLLSLIGQVDEQAQMQLLLPLEA